MKSDKKIGVKLKFVLVAWFALMFMGTKAEVQGRGAASSLQLDSNNDTVSIKETASTTSNWHGLRSAVGIDIRPEHIFPTNDYLRGDNKGHKKYHTGLSGHLKYSMRFAPTSRYGRLYPNAYQGVGIGCNTFFAAHQIGSPISAYVFQGSRIASFAERLWLDYEWNFGASFGWKKYDKECNERNNIIGSKVNAYINVGLALSYRVNQNWVLKAGLDLSHYSNGNTSYPNQGLNTAGVRLGVEYAFGSQRHIDHLEEMQVQPHLCYDLVLYGAVRSKGLTDDERETVIVPGRFGIVGMNFTPMYAVNKYFRFGPSIDIQYDESANIKNHVVDVTWGENIKFFRPPFKEQFTIGVSARAEFTMPIFAVNIGIGYNLFQNGPDTKGLYQVLVLKTFLTPRIFLHTGYMLKDFNEPKNLMLGFGYRF